MKLQNKVVLVTGASRGIGRAIALLFASEGASVAINYNSSEKEAGEIADEIVRKGGKAIAVKCDISSEAQVKTMITQVIKEFGAIDVLVNNAGKIIRPGDSKVDRKTWDDTMDINLTGYWQVIKECVPYLAMQQSASILNIASYVGQLGSQFVLPYGAAKAGVINITKAYAKELAPNIRVNSISPGNVATEMSVSAGEEYITKVLAITPLKRLGTPEELAKAALFLVSDEASFITGVNLDVDGGFMLVN